MNYFTVHLTIIRISLFLVAISIGLMQPESRADERSQRAGSVTVVNSEHYDSVSLLMSAAKAFREGRIEDAGFFYYAGQIRARVDVNVYDPVGTGGNSPVVLFGAMEATLGPRMNATVMRDRELFTRIVGRLAMWTPKFDPGYEPGWEYRIALVGPARSQAIKDVMARRLAPMQSLSELMHDDDYFRSFKTILDYNLGDTEALDSASEGEPLLAGWAKVSRAEYIAAVDRLKQIEKSRGIHSGLFPDKDELKRARVAEYNVVQNKVMYEKHLVASADGATFEVLPDVDYAKDARQVYVRGYVIGGADPKTFRVIDAPYARDKSKAYCGNIPMMVHDVDHFQVMHASSMWEVSFDKSGLSRAGKEFESIVVDEQSPAVTGWGWARDGKNCFFGPAVVEGADYASFKAIDGFYAEDKNQEYVGGRPMPKGSIPAWARDRSVIMDE